MNMWLGSDWDRGYEAGRKAGIEEAQKAKPGSLHNIAFDTGVLAERERALAILKKNACYDAQKDGNCPHGACQQILDAMHQLKTTEEK